MLLHQISPFVRFAFKYPLIPSNHLLSSLDSRLFYIHEGTGIIEINSKQYNYAPYSLFLWQAGTKYKIICNSSTKITSINFDFTDEKMDITEPYNPVVVDNTTESIAQSINFEDCPALNDCVVIENAESLESKLYSLIVETLSLRNFYREKTSALMKSLVIDIVRISSDTTITKEQKKKLKIVLDYIHEHYDEDINNTLLANLVNYHPYYLNRLMVSFTNVSLHQYLINYRVSVAENLLTSTTDSISEIALKTGFSNNIVFTQCFKKKNGITPSKFRKTLNNID